jgi:hypothetical protein
MDDLDRLAAASPPLSAAELVALERAGTPRRPSLSRLNAALVQARAARAAGRGPIPPAPFAVSEQGLTDALFHDAPLGAYGSGTKAEARAQARVMLAGSCLLVALTAVLDALAESDAGVEADHPLVVAGRAAVRLALEGV